MRSSPDDRPVARKLFGSANERRFAAISRGSMPSTPLEAELVGAERRRRSRRVPPTSRSRSPTAPRSTTSGAGLATVREAAKRTIGQRHFDVQLIGGMILHEGKIAEMKTGEGRPWWRRLRSISTR